MLSFCISRAHISAMHNKIFDVMLVFLLSLGFVFKMGKTNYTMHCYKYVCSDFYENNISKVTNNVCFEIELKGHF